jgi:hypothetical protein
VPEELDVRHWPVLAWIRLRLPDPPAPTMLMAGPPPPPAPPLDILRPEAVATDPTVRLYSHLERFGPGAIRLAWQASEPRALVAEYREPQLVARLPAATVRNFWSVVKERLAELGPLPVEAADPRS